MPAMSGSTSAAARSSFGFVSLRSARFWAFSRARSWRAISFCRLAKVALPLLAIESLLGAWPRANARSGQVYHVPFSPEGGGDLARDPNTRLAYSTGGEKEAKPASPPLAHRAPGAGVRLRLERRASAPASTTISRPPPTLSPEAAPPPSPHPPPAAAAPAQARVLRLLCAHI